MSLYSYLNVQHNSALRKAEHIEKLPRQDKFSRKVFTDDLIRHVRSLFMAEQVSLYSAVEAFADSTNFLESSLRNQEMVLSKLKSYAANPNPEDNIPLLLHNYNTNQQAFIYPVARKHLNADQEYSLGNFCAQFYELVFRDVTGFDALTRISGQLPPNMRDRAGKRLREVIKPYPLHQTA